MEKSTIWTKRNFFNSGYNYCVLDSEKHKITTANNVYTK